MSLAYLFDPNLQFQDKSGNNNVNGFLRVYIDNTDDRAVTYKDFNGSLNQADIRLDNNGRAVVIVDDSKTYRLEVYGNTGVLLWTLYPISPKATGINETLEALVAAVKSHTIAIEGLALGKKNKQQAKVISGTPTQTVKSLSQNADGEITVEFEDIDFPYNTEISSPDGSIEVGTPVVDPELKKETIPLSVANKGKVLVDENDSQQKYLEDAVKADENGLLRVRVDEKEDSTPEHPDKVLVIDDSKLRDEIDSNAQRIDSIVDTISELDVDSVPHAYLHSTLSQSAGDSTTTRTTVDIFACDATPVGDCFEFEQTTTIDDTPFGYVWIEPGTYLVNGSVTLQWVGNPRGTFAAKVGKVMGENVDFSQEQELLRSTTRIVTIPNRMKLSINITYDAGTPVMGFWIQSLQVVKLAGGMSQTNITHDSTLVGQGSVADPLGVDKAKVAQSTLAGNVAPAFDPNRTSENPYSAGERVSYNGVLYIFKVPHYGAWVASDAYKAGEFVKQFNSAYFELGRYNSADEQYVDVDYRVRSRVGYKLHLFKGDTIICLDATNSYFWVDAFSLDNIHSYTALPVTSYTASEDVDVILTLGYREVAQIADVVHLVRRFAFISVGSPDECISKLLDDNTIDSRCLPVECFLKGVSFNVSTGYPAVNGNYAVIQGSIHLSAGDFVQFNSGIDARVGFRKIYDDGSEPSGVSASTGFFYIEKDCTCIFVFGNTGGVPLDIQKLSLNFKIYSKDSGFNKFISSLSKDSLSCGLQYDPSFFLYGYSGISNGVYSAVYAGFTGVVTDYLAYVSLTKGDIIKCVNPAYKFRVVVSSNGSLSQSSYTSDVFVINDNADCWVNIVRVDGAVIESDEIGRAVSSIKILSLIPNGSPRICGAIADARNRHESAVAHPGKFRLIAHRGASGIAPENTIPSYIAAKQCGYDFVETDVQFTSDGVPVMLHDETVDRTSNGTGKLYEMTYAQVSELDFGSYLDSRFAGTKIPTLEETLLCCKRMGLGIYLEFKPFGPYTFDSAEVESIIKLVEKYGMMDNVVFTTRNDVVHNLRPMASLQLGGNSINQPNVVQNALAVKGANYVEVAGNVDAAFDAEVCAELIANGIHISVWTSAAQNTVAVMRSLPNCLDAICTNAVDARSLFMNMALHGWE